MECCPICKSPSESKDPQSTDVKKIACLRCGEYLIDGLLKASLEHQGLDNDQRILVSGWIREHKLPDVTSKTIEGIVKSRIPNVAYRAYRLLDFIAEKHPEAGENIYIQWGKIDAIVQHICRLEAENLLRPAQDILPLLGASYSASFSNLSFLVRDYLEQHGYLRVFQDSVRITSNGWEFIENQRQKETSSKLAFVAMWFEKKHVDKLYPIIQNAAKSAGYDARNLQDYDHNNDINDEIIAVIKKCKFLIADFTGQRGGVYFESGFAKGLGKEVIWLCNDNEKDKLHFDTNHYNFIFWEDTEDGLNKLQKKLKARIEATVD